MLFPLAPTQGVVDLIGGLLSKFSERISLEQSRGRSRVAERDHLFRTRLKDSMVWIAVEGLGLTQKRCKYSYRARIKDICHGRSSDDDTVLGLDDYF